MIFDTGKSESQGAGDTPRKYSLQKREEAKIQKYHMGIEIDTHVPWC